MKIENANNQYFTKENVLIGAGLLLMSATTLGLICLIYQKSLARPSSSGTPSVKKASAIEYINLHPLINKLQNRIQNIEQKIQHCSDVLNQQTGSFAEINGKRRKERFEQKWEERKAAYQKTKEGFEKQLSTLKALAGPPTTKVKWFERGSEQAPRKVEIDPADTISRNHWIFDFFKAKTVKKEDKQEVQEVILIPKAEELDKSLFWWSRSEVLGFQSNGRQIAWLYRCKHPDEVRGLKHSTCLMQAVNEELSEISEQIALEEEESSKKTN